MKNKLFSFFIITVLLLFVVSCDNSSSDIDLEENNTGDFKKNETNNKDNNLVRDSEIKANVQKSQENIFSNSNVDINELQNYIFTLDTKTKEFNKNNYKNNQFLYTSKGFKKGWIIHHIDEEDDFITSEKNFYDLVNPSDSKIWKEYLDLSDFERLDGVLNKVELSKLLPHLKISDEIELSKAELFYDYDDYNKESKFVDFDLHFEKFDTQIGTIPKMRIETFSFDNNGKFIENWAEPILVFIIPCSKDTIVYYLPRETGDFSSFDSSGQYKTHITKNWKRIIDLNKDKHLINIDGIIDFCNLGGVSLDESKFSSYQENKKLAINENVFYGKYNLSLKPEISFKDDDRKYEIDQIKMILDDLNVTNIISSQYSTLGVDILDTYFVAGKEYISSYDDVPFGKAEANKIYENTKLGKNNNQYAKNRSLIFRPYFQYMSKKSSDWVVEIMTKGSETYYTHRIYLGQPVIVSSE
jgi:hypothetical protein